MAIAAGLWITALLLAFANGANDNAKGVATLRGSGLAGHPATIAWGTAWTLAGALLSAQIGRGLITLFNGHGLLPAAVAGSEALLLAVALAAAATVLFASRVGAPISTTHALTGALAGTGAAAVGMGQLRLGVLGKGILLPLLISPFLALALTLLLFAILAPLRRLTDTCICLVRREPVLVSGPVWNRTATVQPVHLVVGTVSECEKASLAGGVTPLHLAHWVSAGLMSFSRGLNDTPKIAALLLGVSGGPAAGWAVSGVAFAMALGGLFGARRVARTLSEKITPMDPTQGFSANLITALLVAGASRFGIPVSTTQVACGSLFGIGVLHRGETSWRAVRQIALAWGVTLPAAALLGSVFYALLRILPLSWSAP